MKRRIQRSWQLIRRRYWLSVLSLLTLFAAIYFASFFAVRKVYNVTNGYDMRIYYFSTSPKFNTALWYFYKPLHQSVDQPISWNEWMSEAANESTLYVKEIEPISDMLKP